MSRAARLYVVLGALWVAGWGYAAYDAHRVYAFRRDYMAAVDARPGADRRNYAASAQIRDEYLQKRNRDLLGMLILPLALPLAGALRMWIIRGR